MVSQTAGNVDFPSNWCKRNDVNEPSQVTCPECEAVQSSKSPYCEDCGYRIHQKKTAKEGHQAITPDTLADARRKASESRKKTEQKTTRSAESDERDVPATATERPAVDESALLEGGDPARSSETYMEGLASVDTEATSRGGESDDSSEMSAASQSGHYQAPPDERGNTRMIVWASIWLCLTAIAVLATYFIMKSRQGNVEKVSGVDAPLEKIDVSEGPYLKGLDGEIRSFILQMCMKVEDEPEEACEQKTLLKGEYPQETVQLGAYRIDSKEVTVKRYEKCVSAGDCEPVDYRDCEVWTHQGLQVALRVPKVLRAAERPVVCVRRRDAKSFCEWAGGRLPSADQWEKAARGSEGKLFPWGNTWSSDNANWGELDIARNPIVGEIDGFEWTAPPGSFPDGKSPYGLYDAAGNVAEWVDTDQKIKGQARGGSWTSTPFDLRSTGRLFVKADVRRSDIGFRCAY